jgi:hypothetical protein
MRFLPTRAAVAVGDQEPVIASVDGDLLVQVDGGKRVLFDAPYGQVKARLFDSFLVFESMGHRSHTFRRGLLFSPVYTPTC